MKQNRRLLSLILAVCLIVSLVPAVTPANAATAAGTGSNAVQDGEYVVFGNNTWLVADTDYTTTGVAGLVLLSKDVVDSVAFNEGGLTNGWADSDAKAWADAYAADAFDAGELAAILATTKDATSGTYFNADWSGDALTGEQVFFLSAQEVYDLFGKNGAEGLIATDSNGVATGWWLRSAYTDRDIYAGVVSDVGFVGYPHVAAEWGVRPAINIDGSKVVFSSAAVGGKVSGTTGADALTAVAENTSNTWKLTLADDAHAAFAAAFSGETSVNQGYESWTVSVEYSGAVAGDNEYVSAVITDQVGNVVYYGHIAVNSASGTAAINLPTGLSGKYTLSVFAEQCNGDNNTDYGSPLVSQALLINDQMSTVNTWMLNLNDDISATFNMTVTADVLADETAYIEYGVNGVNETVLVNQVADENGALSVVINCVAAEMTDTMTIQVITASGEGSVFKYNVREYAKYIINDTTGAYTDDQKNLVKAMLNYGARSQEYFGYQTSDKADTVVDVHPTYEAPGAENDLVVTDNSANVDFYGASLIALTKTTVRFYFSTSSVDGLEFLADGSAVTPKKATENLYYVDVDGIGPHELADVITVTVDGLSVTYSPVTYISRMYHSTDSFRSTKELKDMMFAMYNYYKYALLLAPAN